MKKRLIAVLAAVFAATVLGSGAVSSQARDGQDWERRPVTHSVAGNGLDWERAPHTTSFRGFDWE